MTSWICTRVLRWPVLAVAAFGAVCASASAAEDVTVQASADRPAVTIGEPIRYVVTVQHPARVAIDGPSMVGTVGDFHVDRSGSAPDRRDHGMVVTERWYQLSMMSTGTFTIPPPVVTYRGPDGAAHEVRGAAVTVTVKSVLPAHWEAQDIHDIKPPISLRRSWWWLWILGLLAAAGGGLAWWRRRQAQPHRVSGPPPKPAHVIALEALEALRQERLPAQGRYEEYYVRLSNIARRYVEHRFKLRAPEMTTEEFLQIASNDESLTHAQRQLLREFLMHCDLVKFARYQPSEHEAEEMFTAAVRFVQETKWVEELEQVSRAVS